MLNTVLEKVAWVFLAAGYVYVAHLVGALLGFWRYFAS